MIPPLKRLGCATTVRLCIHAFLANIFIYNLLILKMVTCVKIGKPIQCVAVLNAACLQGKSVIKGLLDDRRKEYRVRACICNGKQEPDVQELKSQYPDRITIHHISDDDVTSYTEALKGVEGIFAVSNLQYNQDMSNNKDTNREVQHARYVIDTCSTSNTVCHIVFSSLNRLVL